MRFALLVLLSVCTVIGGPVAWALAPCDTADPGCCCAEREKPSPDPSISQRCGCGCFDAADSPAQREEQPRNHEPRKVEPTAPAAAAEPSSPSLLQVSRADLPPRSPRAPVLPLFALHCSRLN
jgi:hypothetical protein